MLDAFVGTTNGVVRLHDGKLEPSGLDGRDVTALHCSDDELLAGTYGDGLFRSSDRGETDEDVHHFTGHPDDPDLLYVSLGSASLTQPEGRHGGVARSRRPGRPHRRVS